MSRRLRELRTLNVLSEVEENRLYGFTVFRSPLRTSLSRVNLLIKSTTYKVNCTRLALSSVDWGNAGSQIFIPIWLQKKWGDFQTYGGGGYWFNNGTGNRDYWFFGWQGQYQFSEHVTLGAEVFHTTEQVVGQGASTGFNVGGFCNFDEHNHLLFSAGRGIQNAAQTNRVSSYIGYQYTF